MPRAGVRFKMPLQPTSGAAHGSLAR